MTDPILFILPEVNLRPVILTPFLLFVLPDVNLRPVILTPFLLFVLPEVNLRPLVLTPFLLIVLPEVNLRPLVLTPFLLFVLPEVNLRPLVLTPFLLIVLPEVNLRPVTDPLLTVCSSRSMRNQMAYVLLALCAVCLAWAAAAPAATNHARPSKDEALFISRLVAPMRDLANRASEIEALLEEVASNGVPEKRQGGWDMDYGWGGGRFGKRAEAKKRYDMYGMGGRFGRDVDHIDTDTNTH